MFTLLLTTYLIEFSNPILYYFALINYVIKSMDEKSMQAADEKLLINELGPNDDRSTGDLGCISKLILVRLTSL